MTALAMVDEAVQGMRRKKQQTHYAKVWVMHFRIDLPVHVLPSFIAPCFRLVLVRQVLSYSAEKESSACFPMCKLRIMPLDMS